jgi:hypothetical protein
MNMNDRTAEKYYILTGVLNAEEKAIHVEAVREDSEYGTEAYYWILSFDHKGNKVSAESFNFSEAVVDLFEAAEKLGVLDGEFIIG